MGTSPLPPSRLTLWEIESGLLDLLEARDAAEDDAGRAACDQAIAEYVAREIEKVDHIRGLLKHCELVARAAREEAADQEKRARMWEARRDRVKELVKSVMEAHGLKRIEGRTGRLRIQANGGLAPLEITDPEQVPDDCCRWVGWISHKMRQELIRLNPVIFEVWALNFQLERQVVPDLVRRALKDCEVCGGSREMELPGGNPVPCTACGGTGKGGVPGARIGERGSHVRVE